MWMIDQSTRRFVLFAVNLMLRALTFALCWIGIGLISLLLNYCLDFLLGRLGAPDSAENMATSINVAFVLFLGVGIAFTAVVDVIRLIAVSIRQPEGVRTVLDMGDHRNESRE